MTEEKKFFEKEENKYLRQCFTAPFHQDWDLDGDMIDILKVNRGYRDTAKRWSNDLSDLFKYIDSLPEMQEIYTHLGGDYDPSYDGLTHIEWLVLVKRYMQGNDHAFEPTIKPTSQE